MLFVVIYFWKLKTIVQFDNWILEIQKDDRIFYWQKKKKNDEEGERNAEYPSLTEEGKQNFWRGISLLDILDITNRLTNSLYDKKRLMR